MPHADACRQVGARWGARWRPIYATGEQLAGERGPGRRSRRIERREYQPGAWLPPGLRVGARRRATDATRPLAGEPHTSSPTIPIEIIRTLISLTTDSRSGAAGMALQRTIISYGGIGTVRKAMPAQAPSTTLRTFPHG